MPTSGSNDGTVIGSSDGRKCDDETGTGGNLNTTSSSSTCSATNGKAAKALERQLSPDARKAARQQRKRDAKHAKAGRTAVGRKACG